MIRLDSNLNVLTVRMCRNLNSLTSQIAAVDALNSMILTGLIVIMTHLTGFVNVSQL